MGDAEGSLEVGRWGALGLLLCPPRGGSRKAAGGPRRLQPIPSALQQEAAPWLKVGMGLPPKVKVGGGWGSPREGLRRGAGKELSLFQERSGPGYMGPQVDVRTEGDESHVSL